MTQRMTKADAMREAVGMMRAHIEQEERERVALEGCGSHYAQVQIQTLKEVEALLERIQEGPQS